MRLLALAILLPAAAACSSTHPVVAAAPSHDDFRAAGVPMAQPADDPSRLLTPGECETLRAWISDTCRAGTSRSSLVAGWCSDVLSRTSSRSWALDCAAHVPSGELACFLGSSSAGAMMSCDSEIDG
jgi:hypothetical protein